jgi:hypothetical protein
MTKIWNVTKLTLAGTAATLVIGFCAAFLYIAFVFFTQPEKVTQVLVNNSATRDIGIFWANAFGSRDGIREPSVYLRSLPIYSNHREVVRWLQECAKANSFEDFDQDTRMAVSWNPPGVGNGIFFDDENGQKKIFARRPNRQESALLAVSKSLADLRFNEQIKAEKAYSFWQLTTLLSIAIGAITTVLVSLSSTGFGKEGAPFSGAIRLLAIGFPALGTAVAAVVGFYSPQSEWNQSSRTLASAAYLHGQVALTMWKLDCADKGADAAKALEDQIVAWTKQYNEILTLSNAAGQQASSTGGNSGNPAGGAGAGGAGGTGGSSNATANRAAGAQRTSE